MGAAVWIHDQVLYFVPLGAQAPGVSYYLGSFYLIFRSVPSVLHDFMMCDMSAPSSLDRCHQRSIGVTSAPSTVLVAVYCAVTVAKGAACSHCQTRMANDCS